VEVKVRWRLPAPASFCLGWVGVATRLVWFGLVGAFGWSARPAGTRWQRFDSFLLWREEQTRKEVAALALSWFFTESTRFRRGQE
jgi:hypothetical protein